MANGNVYKSEFLDKYLQPLIITFPVISAAKTGGKESFSFFYIQGVPGGKVNILRGYSICHSKQKTLYEHVSYSERFPR